MNTHRRLIMLMLSVVLLFTLACTVVGVQTSTQVYEDERSKTTMLIVMSKEFLSLDPSMEDLWNEHLANIRKYLEQQGATVSDYEDNTVRGIKAVETFNTLDELRSSVSASGTTVFNSFEMKRWRGEYLFDARTTSERIKQRITEITGLNEDDLFMLVAPLIVKLKFPGEMTSNADEVESTGAHVWYIKWWVSGADHRLSATSKVPLREPVILSPESGTAMDSGNKTVSFRGTGEPGSDIVLYRIDGSNRAPMGEGVVAADGTWQFSNVTFSGGQSNPSSDETYTVEVEERVDERTKTSSRTTLVVRALPEATISGRVTSGKGFPLVDVQVRLSQTSADGTRTPQTDFVSTNQDGRYELKARVPKGQYQVEVYLEDSEGMKKVIYEPSSSGVMVWESLFIDPDKQNRYQQDISFSTCTKIGRTLERYVGSGDCPNRGTSLPDHVVMHLDVFGDVYYRIWEVQNFVHNENHYNYQPVQQIFVWSTTNQTIWNHETQIIYVHPDDIIRRNQLDYLLWYQAFQDAIAKLNDMLLTNFSNPVQGKGFWLSGLSQYWICVMNQSPIFFGASLEYNWKAWDIQLSIPREDFAVASLLWDLDDGRNEQDNDNIDMATRDLWNVLMLPDVTDARSLYIALLAGIESGTLQNETAPNVITKADLDLIFISHGFYAEKDSAPGPESRRDDDEEIGSGHTSGTSPPLQTIGGGIQVNVVNQQNITSFEETTVLVTVFFEENNHYTYQYPVNVIDREIIYVTPPPPDEETIITVEPKEPDGKSNDPPYKETGKNYQENAENGPVPITVVKKTTASSWWKNPWLTYGLGGICGIVLLVGGGIAVVVVLNKRGSGRGGRGGRARTTRKTPPTRRPTPTRRSPPTRRSRP